MGVGFFFAAAYDARLLVPQRVRGREDSKPLIHMTPVARQQKQPTSKLGYVISSTTGERGVSSKKECGVSQVHFVMVDRIIYFCTPTDSSLTPPAVLRDGHTGGENMNRTLVRAGNMEGKVEMTVGSRHSTGSGDNIGGKPAVVRAYTKLVCPCAVSVCMWVFHVKSVASSCCP